MTVKSEKDFVKFAEGDETVRSLLLFNSVVKGLHPFRAESIDTWLDYDINMYAYRVFVQANFKDNNRITHMTTIRVDELLADPEAGAKKVADALFEKFRKRAIGYTIPDNIILSEN